MKQTSTTIQVSKRYNEFAFLKGNRPIDTTNVKYRKVFASMKEEGWIESLPATVIINDDRKFLIDGQNRFTAAKELGIPILYVVVKKPLNIPKLSDCNRPWSGNDYAGSYASEGNSHYIKLVAFANRHCISATRAGNLLMAKTKAMNDSNGAASNAIKEGTFTFTAEGLDYAETVLEVCSHLPVKMRKNRSCNAALARLLLIPELIVSTMISKIDANLAMITPKATVDEYIQLFESVYNKRNSAPIPIAMRWLELSRAK